MHLTLRRRARGVLLALVATLTVVLGVSLATPAQAGTIRCGTQSVYLGSIHASFYVSVGCYPGWILMVPGDAVYSGGGSVKIDPRTACNWNYYNYPNVVHTTSNSNPVGGGPIYLTVSNSTVMRDCYNF